MPDYSRGFPHNQAMDDTEFDREYCRLVYGQGGLASLWSDVQNKLPRAQKNWKERSAQIIRDVEAATEAYDDSKRSDPYEQNGDGIMKFVKDPARKAARKGVDLIADMDVDADDYTAGVIQTKLGDYSADSDLGMGLTQARSISANIMDDAHEAIVDPLMRNLGRIADVMDLTDTTHNGQRIASEEQAMRVLMFYESAKDILSGRLQTHSLRYHMELSGDGNARRGEAINQFYTHKDKNRLNQELDRIWQTYPPTQNYKHPVDPAQLQAYIARLGPITSVLDEGAGHLAAMRQRTMELNVLGGRVGPEDQLLIDAYELPSYLPNKGFKNRYSRSPEFEKAYAETNAYFGDDSSELSHMWNNRSGRDSFGENGVSQLYADLFNSAFAVGDTEITRRVRHIGETHGNKAGVAYVGRAKKWETNPNTGERVPTQDFQTLKRLATRDGDRDWRMVLDQDGDYVHVMSLQSVDLAKAIKKSARQSMFDTQSKIGGAISWGTRLQGKMMTTMRLGFLPHDLWRNYKNASAKIYSLHGARAAATMHRKLAKFIPQAIDYHLFGYFYPSRRESNTEYSQLMEYNEQNGFNTSVAQLLGRRGARLDLIRGTKNRRGARRAVRDFAESGDNFFWDLASVFEQSVRMSYAASALEHAPRLGISKEQAFNEQKKLTDFSKAGLWSKAVGPFELFLKPSVNGARDTIDYFVKGKNGRKAMAAHFGWGMASMGLLAMYLESEFGEEGKEKLLDTADEDLLKGMPVYKRDDKTGKISNNAIFIDHSYGGGMFKFLGLWAAKQALRDGPPEYDKLPGLITRGITTHWSPLDGNLFRTGTWDEALIQLGTPVILEPAASVATKAQKADKEVPKYLQFRNHQSELWVEYARKLNEWSGGDVDVTPAMLEELGNYAMGATDIVEGMYDTIQLERSRVAGDYDSVNPFAKAVTMDRRMRPGVIDDFYRAQKKFQDLNSMLEQWETIKVADPARAEALITSVKFPHKKKKAADALESEINNLRKKIKATTRRRSLPPGDPQRPEFGQAQIGREIEQDEQRLHAMMAQYYQLSRTLR